MIAERLLAENQLIRTIELHFFPVKPGAS